MKYKIIATKKGANPISNNLDNFIAIPLEGIPGDFPENATVEVFEDKIIIHVEYFSDEPKIEKKKLSDDVVLRLGKNTGRIYSFETENTKKPFRSWKRVKREVLKSNKGNNRFKNNTNKFEEIAHSALQRAQIANRLGVLST